MRRVAWCVMALLVAGSCGVRVQERPTVVSDAALPAERPEPPAQEVTPDQQPIEVYLVRSDRLVRAERRVDNGGLESSLRALSAGPNESEVELGYRSAIPPGAQLRARSTVGTVASIEVTSAFLNVAGEEQILAIAQVVFTATAVTGVSTVQLLVDGEPTDVPRADGTLSPTPVTRDDYAPIAPAS